MKKYTAFLISAVLCLSLITGKIVQVYAQQEEVKLEESEQVDNTEQDRETVKDPEENAAGSNEQETDEPDTEQSEADTTGDSSESEIPDGSEVPESDHDQTEEEEQQTGSDGDEESEIPEENGNQEESENQEESKIPDENQIPDETKVSEENEGNPDVAAAMESAYTSFYDHISDIAELLDLTDNYTLIEGDDNFCEALAVYAIKHDQTGNYPYDVKITNEADFDELQSIYWSLNMVNGAKNEKDSVIRVTRLSGVDVYALSGSDKKVFQSLTTNKNKEKICTLLSD
ncbi:hypothetical protein [Lacrimispora sp.]|uniref:hypothetical protein n=1 Tax=Lacrimispora sp. TaxID=2719234 RepID=UPI0028617D87|nr:hypothetical protein [Lacrimispora sp.]MDR7811828.1 hypothetical protein [Lacrimispora sp.]